MRKEKFVQICRIQGYEDIKNCYWISNSDEDKIVNRNTGKILKVGLDTNGYKLICLRTIEGKKKTCRIHILKAKAFLFGPNPLGYNVVRHLNDVKTDNRLINLAWGSYSDNIKDSMRNGKFNYDAAKAAAKGGKINGAKNGKKLSKPVRCIETGIIYISACEVERRMGIPNNNINYCCNGKRQTAGGFHWEYVDQITE